MYTAEESWEEHGEVIRARSNVVFVRTDPHLKMSPGGIIYPPKRSGFWSGQPNPKDDDGRHVPVTTWATVLTAGPDTEVKEGDRVFFMRLDFAWSSKFEDTSLLGWVRGENIMLIDEPDEEIPDE